MDDVTDIGNFSDQNCLTRYYSNVLRGETGPDGQNIFVHTDVLINDKYARLSFNMGPVLP